jgi:hypothetical protein
MNEPKTVLVFDPSRSWELERERVGEDICDGRAHATAQCAELPHHLIAHELASEADETFADRIEEWGDWVAECDLWLALEQCCFEGTVLSAELRALRLEHLDDHARACLEHMLRRCPSHVLALLAFQVYWEVRIGRVQRSGSPDWNPRRPIPAEPEESAFFNPPVLRLRRYS